jgi:5S rRNA maturation endonuclease (ribonuclease M5)
VITDSYENILDALRGHGSLVNETGQGSAKAQCPAHDDRNPSLSITKTESRTLLHCHAGCPTEDVLAAVNKTMRDLYNEPFEHPKYGTVCATYNYPDDRVVWRTAAKAFPQPNKAKNNGRSLFHADRIGDAKTVYVVEGEEDVFAVEAAGGTAVCSAMGAGKAHLAKWSDLDHKDVVIVADKDKPGRDHAVQVAAQLGSAASIRIVQAAVGKDISDHISAGKSIDELVPMGSEDGAESAEDDGQTVSTVPWPTLNNTALHATAGKIVNLLAPHTEADPAALLVQMLAEFGATVGSEPHFIAGNDRHQAIVNPLIVGRTNSGAKGTGMAAVNAVRRTALPWFDEFTTSGLSTAEGLIEQVRDPSGDPESKDYDPGVPDKRLLVEETEYKSVLVRMRREGNTLSATLRDTFDCRTLRTLTRKHNKLTATQPHIVVIGHVTPREFRTTLEDSDLSGGSVNRLLICLSRRSRLHSRFGNIPENVLNEAAKLFRDAYEKAVQRRELKFTEEFWTAWDGVYREMNRDRPDSRFTDATARAVTMVLRLSLIYALMEHLNAASALWAYCEDSARWLFSTYEQEVARENAGGLAAFIRDGGRGGRTRTEISVDYFKRNSRAAEISSQLTRLVHDGVVVEIKDDTGARPITRYIHRDQRTNEFTNYAGQEAGRNSYDTNLRTEPPAESGDSSSEFVCVRTDETPSDLHSSLNSLIRKPERETDTNSEPPGAPTENTPGMTERVQQIASKHNGHQVTGACDQCGTALEAPESIARGRCRECHLAAPLADEGAEQ